MPEIGAQLREARMRARIDVSEIEAKTKIRAKYLRALENEEWDLLPGPTFVKSFLRTYAQALDLDSKALLEEYRRAYERPSDAESQPITSAPRPRAQSRTPRSAPSRGYTIAVAGVCVVIVLLLYGLLSGGSHKAKPKQSAQTKSAVTAPHGGKRHSSKKLKRIAPTTRSLASLSLHPSGEVYVCLVGDEHTRIPGLILTPASPVSTYHARRFQLTLGNNALTLMVNGKVWTVPASSKPIGYSITPTAVRTLAAAQQPSCK